MNKDIKSFPSGFDNLLKSRAGNAHWNLLSRLSEFGQNREACAIVESFQQQIAFEKATSAHKLHVAA